MEGLITHIMTYGKRGREGRRVSRWEAEARAETRGQIRVYVFRGIMPVSVRDKDEKC